MKRSKNLFTKLVSDENLRLAIEEVNASHRWCPNHRPNKTTLWVESTKEERVKELREMIVDGFTPSEPKHKKIYDVAARKWRNICEPKLWPDQYVHHAVIQVLTPVLLKKMDKWCCGSIRKRGTHYGEKAIKKWMKNDPKGTKYSVEADIHHFYDSIKPRYVMRRLRRLIKDSQVLELVWILIKDGIKIGYYFSQWFANMLLQPLDQMIRESGLCSHYVRYMDNFTIFGSNKRKLRRLLLMISEWLGGVELELKGNWQVFRASIRMPDALGFRYGRGFTFIRKTTILRTKKKLFSLYKKVDRCKKIMSKAASGVVTRLGQFKHANTKKMRARMVRQNFIKMLKNIVRKHAKQEELQWNMALEMYMERRRSAELAA